MHSRNHNIYSGTSGLVLPVPKLLYPPAFQGRSRLEYYASLFNSVEVNSSFYKMPMATTIAKWTACVGSDFQFTFKLSKEITHANGLAFDPDVVKLFMETIAHAANKKGCLLIQLPPSLKADKAAEFENLLESIANADLNNCWKVAVEFRNYSWYQQDVYDLLATYKTSMVIHDLSGSASPIETDITGFRYLRFHGPGGRYRGSYTDEFLQQYAQYIKRWIQEGKTVYCYFNNTMGDAFKNLETLNRLVLK